MLPQSVSFTASPDTTMATCQNDTLNASSHCIQNETDAVSCMRDGSIPYPSCFNWPHIILASMVVTLIMLVIVIGNCLVIIAIATDRQLKGVQNWFIASLAVSDLCVGLLIMPLSLANELMGYWHFGEVMCDLWLSTDVLLCTASILNLCLISLDRYWSITKAVAYVKQRTKKRAVLMISLVWILSMILCFPPLAGWKRPQPQDDGFPLCLLSEEPGYIVYSTMGSFYIPLVVMVLVYFKIYLAARARAWRNVRKPPVNQSAAPNSKSTSTSFSNPQQLPQPSYLAEESVMKYGQSLASCSDEDDLVTVAQEHYDEYSEYTQTVNVGTSTSDADFAIQCQLNCRDVLNHKGYVTSADERKNLLSEDTDTDVDKLKTRNSISLSDKCDTKSPPDTVSKAEETDVGKMNGSYCRVDLEDVNAKPLLDEAMRNSNREKRSDVKQVHLDIPEAIVTKPALSLTEGSPRRKNNKNKHNNRGFLPPGRASLAVGKQISFRRKKKTVGSDAEKTRRKIARAKERRATIVLGIIMITFIGCWLPFFSVYLITSLAKLTIPQPLFATIFWLGYCNSALNPIIYTIFNKDFRQAFQRILSWKRWCRS